MVDLIQQAWRIEGSNLVIMKAMLSPWQCNIRSTYFFFALPLNHLAHPCWTVAEPLSTSVAHLFETTPPHERFEWDLPISRCRYTGGSICLFYFNFNFTFFVTCVWKCCPAKEMCAFFVHHHAKEDFHHHTGYQVPFKYLSLLWWLDVLYVPDSGGWSRPWDNKLCYDNLSWYMVEFFSQLTHAF